ncbi:hypothetical protein EI555_003274 [Monodon monoceros]|uniref:Uncharacterized protein n=1 Tax=Monodon monoceros TaxID=40151 RepID=A0A4U1EHE3_MONMO|nr:hypothetical protein EI555_003274 [Monodon monoceros]
MLTALNLQPSSSRSKVKPQKFAASTTAHPRLIPDPTLRPGNQLGQIGDLCTYHPCPPRLLP